MEMNERFLGFLWKNRYMEMDLHTESGEKLEVINPGDANHDSGPDFFNARIRIGETMWAGNVEIHVNASDWYRHGHDTDHAYDHVILHVVYEADRPVLRPDGGVVETLVLKDRFPPVILDRYRLMMTSRQWIPCYNQLGPAMDPGFGLWAPALAVERLEERCGRLKEQLRAGGYDWDGAFFVHLAGCFGFKLNQLAFEMLAKSVPFRILVRYAGDLFRLEALLFGQSGLLGDHPADPYPAALLAEYRFLQAKHRLEPVRGELWKFLRLRPSNFPSIRISQLAGLIHQTDGRLFSLLEEGDLESVMRQLRIRASVYWDDHFIFDRRAPVSPKTMGESCIALVVINGIAPFLFLLGLEKGRPDLCRQALAFLEQTAPEKNSILAQWQPLGFDPVHALQSQALIQLKTRYCDRKRCLECRIGAGLLGISPEWPVRRERSRDGL